MSSLTPNGVNTVAYGSSPSCTLVISGLGVSAAVTNSNGGYALYSSPGTYEVAGVVLGARESIYVIVYNSDGSQTNLSCSFEISGSPGVNNAYSSLKDYTAPTVGSPKRVYTPDLFDDKWGTYGIGIYPNSYSFTDGSGHIPYYGGSNIAGASVPVSITTNTPSTINVAVNTSLILTVGVTGTAPFTYQWYKNGSSYGSPINTSSISNTLTETNRQSSDSGATYYCKVTNAYNIPGTNSTTTTSTVTTVSGYRPTTGTGVSAFPQGVDTGSSSTIDNTTVSSVVKTGSISTTVYYFTGFGTGVVNGALNLRATTITESNISVDTFNTAISSVLISYSYNGSAYNNLVTATEGITDISSLSPVSTSTLSGVDLSTLSVKVELSPDKRGSTYDTVAIASAELMLYDLVFITDSSTVITTNISGTVVVNAGSSLVLTVAASGPIPMTFTWYKNGSSYWTDPSPSGGTSSTLTETSRTVPDTGTTYYCHVSNAYGSASSGTVTLSVASVATHNRPTATSGSYSSPTINPISYAYDTTANSVDTTTEGQIFSTTGVAFVDFTGSAPAISGTLNIRASANYAEGGAVAGTVPSNANLKVSTDGGTTYGTPIVITSASFAIYTVTLTSITLAQLRVMLTTYSTHGGSLKLTTDWDNQGYAVISDIVVL